MTDFARYPTVNKLEVLKEYKSKLNHSLFKVLDNILYEFIKEFSKPSHIKLEPVSLEEKFKSCREKVVEEYRNFIYKFLSNKVDQNNYNRNDFFSDYHERTAANILKKRLKFYAAFKELFRFRESICKIEQFDGQSYFQQLEQFYYQWLHGKENSPCLLAALNELDTIQNFIKLVEAFKTNWKKLKERTDINTNLLNHIPTILEEFDSTVLTHHLKISEQGIKDMSFKLEGFKFQQGSIYENVKVYAETFKYEELECKLILDKKQDSLVQVKKSDTQLSSYQEKNITSLLFQVIANVPTENFVSEYYKYVPNETQFYEILNPSYDYPKSYALAEEQQQMISTFYEFILGTKSAEQISKPYWQFALTQLEGIRTQILRYHYLGFMDGILDEKCGQSTFEECLASILDRINADICLTRKTLNLKPEASQPNIFVKAEASLPEIDPYEVLEVEKGSDWPTIKKAYYKLSLRYHPDKQQNKSEEEKKTADEQYKKVRYAYEMLESSVQDKNSNTDNAHKTDSDQPPNSSFLAITSALKTDPFSITSKSKVNQTSTKNNNNNNNREVLTMEDLKKADEIYGGIGIGASLRATFIGSKESSKVRTDLYSCKNDHQRFEQAQRFFKNNSDKDFAKALAKACPALQSFTK